MLKTFINSFVLFFITIDTIGNLPFFLSLTEDAKFKKRTQIAIKSTFKPLKFTKKRIKIKKSHLDHDRNHDDI